MGGEDVASDGHSRVNSHAALRTSHGHARDHVADGCDGGHSGSCRRSLPLSDVEGAQPVGCESDGSPSGSGDIRDACERKERKCCCGCFCRADGVEKMQRYQWPWDGGDDGDAEQ
jgi:hypothetical protein